MSDEIISGNGSVRIARRIRKCCGNRYDNFNGAKFCYDCEKGFNKKKGRCRVDSSLTIIAFSKAFLCTKCFKPESK